ncbi:MAG: AMP-binding protein [Gammaproteobacteria bacterium]|nr:AMP-binding protein [Gammaproteobacteria bacterium]
MADGTWGDDLIIHHFDRVAAEKPDAIAVVDDNSETGIATTLSFRQVKRLADRVAAGLLALGIGPGDVVAAQLPNWWHYFVLYPACARIGAVFNPLMPIFRQRELKFMLGFANTKLVVVPQSFRGFDYPAMIEELRPELPALEQVLVVNGVDPATSFENVLLSTRWEDGLDLAAHFAPHQPEANAVTELMYTSGTTGQPKGVMHTANTLLCKSRLAAALFEATPADVVYMGSPLAHQTGFMYACVFSLVNGLKCVLQDVWDPVVAAQKIQDEGCTLTLGSTPFLSDLINHEEVRRYDISSLRLFLCAGAPIPRVLLRASAQSHPNMYVMSAWGMTENGIVTATYPGDSEDKVFETDGRALPGQEVRVVDDTGTVLPSHTEGRLQARGPTTFVGYFQRPDAYEIDDDWWFETGDNARMDDDGYIRISGRSKDIIIRGGENIPVVEVEELLYRHPAIQDAAIVGMPDARLGERGCAFVQLKPNTELTFSQMLSYLNDNKLTKNYLPERLEIVAEFPRTPSGKIQKFKLRETAVQLEAGK